MKPAAIAWSHVRVAIGALHPWEHNPRFSTKAQARKILEAFDVLGQFQTIAIGPAPTCNVYDGHQRLSALMVAEGVGFVVDALQSSRELTDDERKQLIIAANGGASGSWDWDKVAALWSGDDIGSWGFDKALLDGWRADVAQLSAMIDANKPPAPPDAGPGETPGDVLRRKWKTEPGQLWLLGDHRLVCGDATHADVVAMLMRDERAACVWSDPPYGVDYVGKTADALTIENDDAIELDALLIDAFRLADGVMEPGAPFYIAHPPGALRRVFRDAAEAVGWSVHQELIWAKNEFVLGHSDYHYQHEPIMYGWSKGPGRSGRGKHAGSRWHGDNAQSSVFNVDRPKRSEMHPTTKPVELIEPMLVNSTADGAVVLDMFGGSGSTLIACERIGRRCRMIELTPENVAIIVERWHNTTGLQPEIGE